LLSEEAVGAGGRAGGVASPANRFAQPFPEFGKLFRPEDEQGYRKDHQQVQRLEKAFTHLIRSSLSDRLD
jgi:hypothetical protein